MRDSTLHMALREIVHTRIIRTMDDLTSDEWQDLTALYLDQLSEDDQLAVMIYGDGNNSDTQTVLEALRACLRNEDTDARGIMNPRILLAHQLTIHSCYGAYDGILEALEDVLTEDLH